MLCKYICNNLPCGNISKKKIKKISAFLSSEHCFSNCTILSTGWNKSRRLRQKTQRLLRKQRRNLATASACPGQDHHGCRTIFCPVRQHHLWSRQPTEGCRHLFQMFLCDGCRVSKNDKRTLAFHPKICLPDRVLAWSHKCAYAGIVIILLHLTILFSGLQLSYSVSIWQTQELLLSLSCRCWCPVKDCNYTYKVQNLVWMFVG